MTKKDVLKVIKTWIDNIINVENNLNYNIIFGNQNAPRPPVPYIVVQNPIITDQKMGRGNWQKWKFTDEPQDEGQVDYTILYEASIQLEEVGNDGNSFRLLSNSINRQDVLDYFSQSKVSILRLESDISNVDITGSKIEKRVIKDIMIAWVDEDNYDPSYINNVDVTGEYIKT